MTGRKTIFFVSYSKVDRPWAEWVAWQLEAAGYAAILQAWDFKPGDDFIGRMSEALQRAHQTIALISPDYLASYYCKREWTAALALESQDNHRLVPVRIAACDTDPLLATRVYVDFVGLGGNEARDRLLEAVAQRRVKPLVEPPFPGHDEPRFPAQTPEIPLPRDAIQVGQIPPNFPVVGRDAEIDRLVASLIADETFPIPVIGPPGVGKSAVCIKALHSRPVAGRFGNRRYFVRCNGAQTAEAALTMIASSLGLRTGTADPLPQVCAVLAKAPAVLVLDNADTPWDADADATVQLLRRLAAIDGVALVATIRGQQRPPQVPWADSISVTPLQHDAAKRLFLTIAGPQYAPDPNLDDLVAAQDGLPLTIELVASLAEGEPDLADLWEQWGKERGALLQRHAYVDEDNRARVSFEMAINSPRNGPAGRRLLALLGVLPEGIARSDVEILLPGEGNDAARTLRRVGLVSDVGQRIRALQPIADYVRQNYPPDQADLDRAAAHYRRLGEDLGGQAGAPGGAVASARLSAEIGNLDAMLHLGFHDDAPQPSIDAAVSIASFMRFSGLGSTQLLESAREAARRIGDVRRQARTLNGLGHIAFVRSQHDTAAERFEDALRLLDPDGADAGLAADCIKGLGHVGRARRRPLEARSRYEAARRLFLDAGDPVGQADAIAGLADLSFDERDLDSAQRLYEEARPLYQRSHHVRGVANCIADLGWIALKRRQHGPAYEMLLQSRHHYEQIGHLHGIAKCERGLGHVALARREYADAEQHYRKAEDLYAQVGARREQALAVLGLGDVARATHRRDVARAGYERAAEIAAGTTDGALTTKIRARLYDLISGAG